MLLIDAWTARVMRMYGHLTVGSCAPPFFSVPSNPFARTTLLPSTRESSSFEVRFSFSGVAAFVSWNSD